MDLGYHQFSYFFKKRKNAFETRKTKLSLSYEDFHCFELMGGTHVRFPPFNFSKKSLKKRICKNTRISENLIKTNVISTFDLPKSLLKFDTFFSIRQKQNRI